MPELIYKLMNGGPRSPHSIDYLTTQEAIELGREIRAGRQQLDASASDKELMAAARELQSAFWWIATGNLGHAKNEAQVAAGMRQLCMRVDRAPTDLALVSTFCNDIDFGVTPFRMGNLLDVPVFKVDNVAQYLEAIGLDRMKEDEYKRLSTDLKTVPLVPPYEDFFMEWKYSGKSPSLPRAAGMLCSYRSMDDLASDPTFGEMTKSIRGGSEKGIVWQLVSDFGGKRAVGPMAVGLIPLREDGGRQFILRMPKFVDFLQKPTGADRNFAADTVTRITPMLFSLLYMNCRNVRTVETPAPTPKISRPAARSKGEQVQGVEKYYVLDIEALAPVLERAKSASPGSQLETALHTVRAHPKRYTAEAPLMGKAVGTFLWNPQVRGNPEKGVIVKDYNVKGPEAPGTDSGLAL